jgi:hypothetical protein
VRSACDLSIDTVTTYLGEWKSEQSSYELGHNRRHSGETVERELAGDIRSQCPARRPFECIDEVDDPDPSCKLDFSRLRDDGSDSYKAYVKYKAHLGHT